ncbi:nitroreductase [Bacillus mojavensis]|uniref:nitroreductase family protein n=1 Tax=Bacillus mojavensis TaxID=72360 RepID=UPI000289632B|nr:nitroreductase [Bacillus mojavensis]MDR4229417.1 nitroreductase [Bacillus mojavensis]MEC1666553.1 nitroreductase [Bacillus mojavensis]MEC3587458.1 nitroreductase [Bacillus mojavensis]MEC5245119.1 nitroreductase [Bacillus mojavensis]MED0750777.1 nitroreductase [Bacillus mojavensis]
MPQAEQINQDSALRDIIRSRRSIRKFKQDPVPPAVILDMLETAKYAPNHRVTEPWRFIYVSSETGKAGLIKTFASFSKKSKPDMTEEKLQNFKKTLSRVPGFLLVVFQEDENERARDDDFAATSSLIQNLQLLAWEKGIGMVWKSGKILYDKDVHQAFGLQDNERFAAIIQTGYPDEMPEVKKRTPIKERFTEL